MIMEKGFVRHVPCETCGSSDAGALYEDGHIYCHKCGAYSGDKNNLELVNLPKKTNQDLLNYSIKPLKVRGITESTCQFFNYGVGRYNNQPVHVANYFSESGIMVAQKLRFQDKSMIWKGDPSKITLFGSNKWKSGGKRLVITEGEIDTLSISQLQGNKWPVVSIPNGASAAKKDIIKSIEWVEKFDEIVICFDNDEVGRKAANEVATILSPGKVKIANLSLKDANEMLLAGKSDELVQTLWNAKAWTPGGIISARDALSKALQSPEWGLDWPWEAMTKLTYGRRRKEIYAFGAGTGQGKTDVFTQIIAQTLNDLELPVGIIFLEQDPSDTLVRVAGKLFKKKFHIPDGNFTLEEREKAIRSVLDLPSMLLYDHFGNSEWLDIKNKIRYFAHQGIKDIFLDHLTALTSHEDDERKALDRLMDDMASIAKELDVTIYFVSHLATPEGRSHEEGGRVKSRDFRGSRSIAMWSHYMFGLERNQQEDDIVKRNVLTVRILKDRYLGHSAGHTFLLQYNHDTGYLTEIDEMPESNENGELHDF